MNYWIKVKYVRCIYSVVFQVEQIKYNSLTDKIQLQHKQQLQKLPQRLIP